MTEGATGLENEVRKAAHTFLGGQLHLAISAEEFRQWGAITAQANNQRARGDLPMLAVTAGTPVLGMYKLFPN